jgi:acyl-[acyl-carrier-protein]-phospholipid O-acyltransferase/long-chain-fatty-acid--[acyl-carrier-protein] ligase
LLPINLSKKLIGIPKYATNEEVALLFTSGSSGKPKGVMLGHDNIISNINGINAMQKFETDSKILANLPLFHSFGFTVTMWFPLINDIKIVTVPSPLEIQKSIDVIQKEQINVLLGTPTFLNGYLKKGTSNKLKSVKYVIAGAEKSKIEFMNQWENTIDCVYLEGYGLTETSPVCCLNTPDSGIKKGSVGKLLPNIMIKTKNPDTLQDLRIHESGLLCFKGPNIFGGYLKEFEKTLNAFEQDWFITGDIGHLDEQGFVHIEGRLSRFSKIGGEMIPHETIESVAVKILNLENEEQISLIVTGRPHETKGEELVLLTTKTINFKELKQKLSNELGNLFVPKIHKKVDEIPVLPTGKLDLQSIKELVNEK